MQNGIDQILVNNPVIPVVNISEELQIQTVYESLKNKGIGCIEITLRSDFAWEAISIFKEKYGHEISVGVGTIINPDQVFKCQELEVDFIVCPGLTPALIQPLESCGIPFLPGVCTPSEIMRGLHLGWTHFKFFPAELYGGLSAIKTWGGVFPEAKFCPTGGIDQSNFESYLQEKNVLSVGGSWVTK